MVRLLDTVRCDAQRTSLVDGTNRRGRRTLAAVHEPGGSMGNDTNSCSSHDVHRLRHHAAARGADVRRDVASEQLGAPRRASRRTRSRSASRSSTSTRSRTSSTTTFGDTEAISKVFVDDINKNGGINGRKIVPVYKKYPPIPGGKPDPLSLCTAFAEDDKVFAVLGVFIDFTGQGQKCVTKEHNVVHIGHELDQPLIDASPGGLMLTPDRTKEHVAAALISLMASTGKLKGKTVAVVGDKNNESRVNDVIVPALKKAKAKTGSTRHPQHHRHRHHRGAGAGRQLHREVEDRGRQHGVPRRQPRLGEAVRRVDQGGAAEGDSSSPTPTPRSTRPRASRTPASSRTRTRA